LDFFAATFVRDFEMISSPADAFFAAFFAAIGVTCSVD
jgi:hypothetical protein